MKLYQGESFKCRDWMFKKACDNKQSKWADNGLCEDCEKERRKVLGKQLEDLCN